MDDNKVSVVAVDIINLQKLISDSKQSRNNLSKIRQMLHHVGGQLDECTSTSIQIDSLNSQKNFFSQDGDSTCFGGIHKA